jgi:ABC-type multidrug transport system ATPase subunit
VFSLKSVRHRYGAREVLSLERFEAAQGEKWLVLGPSGSGKSTLLHILAGLLKPSAGSVQVARPIGIVPQKLHLIASLTVEQNLLLAQYLAGVREEPARY